jgi:exonuclease III
MKDNRLHVLGISECKWKDCGKNTTTTGEVIVYSGRKDNQYHEGEAIILSKTAAKALVEYHPVNERIIRARLKTKPVQTSIIQVYAPTNEAEDEVKQEFYEALQARYDDHHGIP